MIQFYNEDMIVKYIGPDITVVGPFQNQTYSVISIEKGWYRILTLDGDYLYPPHLFEVLTDSKPLFDSFNYCSFYKNKWRTLINEAGVCLLFTEGNVRDDQILEILRKALEAGCREFHLIGERAHSWENLIDSLASKFPLLDSPTIMTMAYPKEETSVDDVISILGDYSNPRHVYFIYDDRACGTCYYWVGDFLERYMADHPD